MGLRQPASRGSCHGRKRAARARGGHGVATLARAIFLGSDTFSVPILDALLRHGPGLDPPVTVAAAVTRPDRPIGRGRKLQTGPVKALANDWGVPVIQPEKARNPEAVASILAFQPDVMVVASYGEILPSNLIDAPPHRTLNLHPSLLPKYRGSSPVSGAILAGDAMSGTSVMLITEKMDAGPILAQVTSAIGPEETAGELESRLSGMSADLLLETLPCWLHGEITPQPQDENEATYTRRLTKEDGLIDWDESASTIARRVRAYNPWPGAFTLYRGRHLKILRGALHPGDAPRGVVVMLPSGDPAVGTGESLLRLDEVQLSGGRPMRGRDLLLGHRELVGSRVG